MLLQHVWFIHKKQGYTYCFIVTPKTRILVIPKIIAALFIF